MKVTPRDVWDLAVATAIVVVTAPLVGALFIYRIFEDARGRR